MALIEVHLRTSLINLFSFSDGTSRLLSKRWSETARVQRRRLLVRMQSPASSAFLFRLHADAVVRIYRARVRKLEAV